MADYPNKDDIKDAQQLARDVSPTLLALLEADEIRPENSEVQRRKGAVRESEDDPQPDREGR
jgi:hypothetical protein